MAKSIVRWIGARRFLGIDSTQHSLVIDYSPEGGNVGIKPSDLLLLGLGSCSAFNIPEIMRKKRQRLAGLEVKITADHEEDPPWTFRSFHLRFEVKGHDLSEKEVAEAIRIAEEDFCSIAATLRLAVPVTHDFVIITDE